MKQSRLFVIASMKDSASQKVVSSVEGGSRGELPQLRFCSVPVRPRWCASSGSSASTGGGYMRTVQMHALHLSRETDVDHRSAPQLKAILYHRGC